MVDTKHFVINMAAPGSIPNLLQRRWQGTEESWNLLSMWPRL